jgi:hypothetical protein
MSLKSFAWALNALLWLILVYSLSSCTVAPLVKVNPDGGQLITGGESTAGTKSEGAATVTDAKIVTNHPNGAVTTTTVKQTHITKGKDETIIPVAGIGAYLGTVGIKDAGKTARHESSNFTSRENARTGVKALEQKGKNDVNLQNALNSAPEGGPTVLPKK